MHSNKGGQCYYSSVGGKTEAGTGTLQVPTAPPAPKSTH